MSQKSRRTLRHRFLSMLLIELNNIPGGLDFWVLESITENLDHIVGFMV